jgi:HSP20 family protein
MPWDPLREFHQAWQERLGRLASPHSEPWAPPIDVYETPETYVITAEVPGLKRDAIAIELKETRLIISGRRPGGSKADETVHYHQVERGHGAFSRTFEFTEKIDPDGVSADLADGVLSVTLRKVPPPPPRRIQVK